MNKATTATPVAAGTSAWVTALKAGTFLLVMMRLAGGLYGFFWGVFALPQLDGLLGAWHVTDYAAALSAILGLALVPLTFALLFVLAPMVGWWIYSRVEPARHNLVGWGAVGFYLLGDTILSVFTGIYSVVALGAGALIVGLYTMFWMGIGFNLAKLFRIKL